jgi:hypothetical protein
MQLCTFLWSWVFVFVGLASSFVGGFLPPCQPWVEQGAKSFSTWRPLQSSSNDNNWEYHYQLYLNYTAQNPDTPVPLNHPELGNWVRKQRLDYRRWQQGSAGDSKEPERRIKQLQQAGFVFDVQDHVWHQKYRKLMDFYDQHGHTRVAANHELGRWASTQRRLNREELLSEERRQLLQRIDFCWNITEDRFRDKVQQVLNGTKMSVWDYKVTDGPLGLWVCHQRTEYRKYCRGRPHGLSNYQIDLLEKDLRMNCAECLDTNREPRAPLDVEWAERMRQLEQFKKENGHVNVPRTCTNHTNLGAWVSKVRERYRWHGESSSDVIKQRLKDLEEIGFIWDVLEYKWQRKFEELYDFFEKNGHVNVPDSHGSLGPWVKEQRREFHKFRSGEPSRLTPQHAMALNRIGLDWNRQSTIRLQQGEIFGRRLQEYRSLCADGSSSASSLPKSLRYWVERQRKLYRRWLHGESCLPRDRRILLEEAGIVEGILPPASDESLSI